MPTPPRTVPHHPAPELPPRAPVLDWARHYDPLWPDPAPLLTHAFDALSLLIPWGEKHIVEVAGMALERYDLSGHPDLRRRVGNVIVQETIHTRQHDRYNALLYPRGHVGDFGRLQRLHWQAMQALHRVTGRRFSPLTRLAFVCAFEHYTAVIGDYILDHTLALAHAPKEVRLVWCWHAAEEVEHKAVCFDLYRACGGGELRRIGVFLLASAAFGFLFGLTYLRLLHQDRNLPLRRLIPGLGRILAALVRPAGIGRHLLRHFLAYLRPDFHPWHHDNLIKAQVWLENNQAHLRTRAPMATEPPAASA
jgi:predicted metal-dependent hydrolase